jgi:hypothetical protein
LGWVRRIHLVEVTPHYTAGGQLLDDGASFHYPSPSIRPKPAYKYARKWWVPASLLDAARRIDYIGDERGGSVYSAGQRLREFFSS